LLFFSGKRGEDVLIAGFVLYGWFFSHGKARDSSVYMGKEEELTASRGRLGRRHSEGSGIKSLTA